MKPICGPNADDFARFESLIKGSSGKWVPLEGEEPFVITVMAPLAVCFTNQGAIDNPRTGGYMVPSTQWQSTPG